MVLTETQDRQILVNSLRKATPELRHPRFSFFDSLVKELARQEAGAPREESPLFILDTMKFAIFTITRGTPLISSASKCDSEPVRGFVRRGEANVGAIRSPCQHLIEIFFYQSHFQSFDV
jgi:hypothetical protein